jgi:hypothetical protein
MAGCQGKKANVEKFMEDGVEVVLNFSLSESKSEYPVLSPILSIDTENDELAEYGLNDIWGFDVNSSGDIFIFNHPLSQEGLILKFNGTGEFIKSFGRRGQGPGEIQLPLYQKINLINEVSVLDFGGQKLIVFDEFGDIVREFKPEIRIFDRGILLPLTNGNYLYRNLEMDESRKSISLVLFLIDSKFEEIAELGRISIENPRLATQFTYPYPVLTWGLSNMHIFVGLEEKGYDIHVYDFEGQLIRKIRKRYTKIPFSEESRRQALKRWEAYGSISEKIVTPGYNPPFQHLFADELGRLFVVTFEPGNNEGEYMTDVFDTDGVLFSRLSLRLHLNKNVFLPDGHWDSWVTAKKNILYCIQEKASGYKELVAYKIAWE